ncbi:MAG TPA: zinc-dependent alcohol dehydrogenase [Blastocatellia bacterium]|jgi:propanol-preferring alcohol dehydrogenase|nr:zinc-dependent alcohol dehydrogenase [Blastocatellia bacterium]
MKAAVVREFKAPLSIEDMPIPRPASDEVLIKVEACGVCHSDLHLAEGDWLQLKKLVKQPLIPGHEVVGSVIERGEAVTNLEVGDRVGVAWVHWTCGECEFCREGNENLCSSQTITGASVDGGFAEFIAAKASHALKVPDALTAIEAAPLFCAGVTVYRAIRRAELRPGQRVAVFGIGGLGHLAVQIAKTFGAEVTAVDIAEDKLELARSFGADHTLNAATEDVARHFRKGGGVHTAVVTSAAKKAYDQAFYSVRSGGTLAAVGMPADDLSFPAIMMREIRIMSSATGTREEQREVLNLAAAGRLRCRVESRSLEEINEIFDEMRRGQISGRAVLTF